MTSTGVTRYFTGTYLNSVVFFRHTSIIGTILAALPNTDSGPPAQLALPDT